MNKSTAHVPSPLPLPLPLPLHCRPLNPACCTVPYVQRQYLLEAKEATAPTETTQVGSAVSDCSALLSTALLLIFLYYLTLFPSLSLPPSLSPSNSLYLSLLPFSFHLSLLPFPSLPFPFLVLSHLIHTLPPLPSPPLLSSLRVRLYGVGSVGA